MTQPSDPQAVPAVDLSSTTDSDSSDSSIAPKLVDGDELRLSAPEGIPESQRIVRSRISGSVVEAPSRSKHQFTITGLMIISLGICFGLSGASWIPATVFAGLVGVLLLLIIGSAMTSPNDTVLSYTLWIGIILAYVSACIIALIRLTSD